MFPSDVISDQYANDTITRIHVPPHPDEALRTIEFNGDSSLHPSLWDVVILFLVVYKDSPLGRQCYSFADAMFGSLEMWAAIQKNGRVEEKRIASLGSHRRNPEDIARIWDNFTKELQVMTQQVRIFI